MEIGNITNKETQALQEMRTSVRTESKEVTEQTDNKSENNKEGYTAISKDGDTLEISSKMTDAALTKCSTSKLKQLLQQGQISKQQYEKAMKRHQ